MHKKRPRKQYRVFFNLAMTYFPDPVTDKYRRRYNVSLLCSGWEEVVPLRYNHQTLYKNIHPKICLG